MLQAIAEARDTDAVSTRMGNLLIGRLRHCSRATLRKLKRELQAFDAKQGVWK